MTVVEHGSFSIDYTSPWKITCHKCGGHNVDAAWSGGYVPNDPHRWTAEYGMMVPVFTLHCNTCGNEVVEES